MPCLEFEGKNVDKAVKKACEELNIPADKLYYDIISYGSTGIFGLVGTKKARIRVTVPDSAPEIKNHAENILEKENKEEDILLSKEEETEDDDNENDESLTTDNLDEEIEEYEDDMALPSDSEDIKDDETEEEVSYSEEETACNDVPSISDEAIESGLKVLQKIAQSISSDSSVKYEQHKNRILYKIEGNGSGPLIGKRGQTLEATQYIIEKVVNKKSDQRVFVQVDVGGYLESRRKSLRILASKLAEKARRTGKPTSLGQMNAHDRKIVHLALKDNHDIRTQSLGEGYYRKLVIFPKRNK